ncbi:MAG: DndE family protein [Lachnospiraceae bacterium]
MIYKLRTSKETQKIFESIGTTEGLQPFALAKIAIALSIRSGQLETKDFQSNAEGLELNRQTIFGEQEMMFRALLTMEYQAVLADEDFFPHITKAHLDRGAVLLQNEAKYGMHFYRNLLSLDDNI